MNARTWAAAACVAGGLIGGGCTRPSGERVVVVLPGEYERAFEASRQVLLDHRFVLDRVDARGGVLTTQPKDTAGLASPWDLEQSTLTQEWEDLTNQQRRVARITFAPQGEEAPAAPDQALPDLRTDDRTLVGRVEVTVLRVHTAGWRPETESIAMTSRWRDPTARQSGVGGSFETPVGRDDALASRLADRIRMHLGQDSEGRHADEGQHADEPAPGG